MTCPNCGGHNPAYRRSCAFCGTILDRPPLSPEEAEVRDLFLSMSLGAADFSTLCFALGIDWHELVREPDEAMRAEMVTRELGDRGRLNEVEGFLRDFRFPQSYPPLPKPYPDNLWLTYVYACQNVKTLDQLQALCEYAGLGNAQRLPGEAMPHKIREALRIAVGVNRLALVHEYLQRVTPATGLRRRDRRRRNRR
jgi:hypothetical protein